MGDPVVCTLVLVRDISLSLSLWPFILGQLWYLLQTHNISPSKLVRIVNIFKRILCCAFGWQRLLMSVADPS